MVRSPILMSKFPITNSQFAGFVSAGGYGDRRWWTSEGWRWRNEYRVVEPKYWRVGMFNTANQPVVGVSFWEAEAFCNWCGCRLPDADESVAAAGGTRPPAYPWGDEPWDGACNSAEVGLGATSPVGLFPDSRSRPFGFDDMAGNVWEWTTTEFDDPTSVQIIGGSWSSTLSDASLDSDVETTRGSRDPDLGFRVIRQSR
jgi:formylglycine-generating enzyme required for sulfatase activity